MEYRFIDNYDIFDEIKDKYEKAAIIWDENIDSKIVSLIGNKFKDCIALSVEGKDRCKTIETYNMVLSHLITFNLDRTDLIIGIGGGSTLDLAGFVASTYLRGVDLIYIPTTILSMVDSSIGGKNGINIDGVKNMSGNFYDPIYVLFNLDNLNTLGEKEYKEGVTEAIKIGATSDKDLFYMLKEKPLFKNRDDKEYAKDIIERAVKDKLKVISDDYRDKGIRKVLNFGHTFGHAIESATRFSIYHGEAVAMGMVMELSLLGNMEALKEIKDCLKHNGLSSKVSIDRKSIIKEIAYDKKRMGDYITLPTVKEIGTFEFVKINIKDIY